MSEISKYSSIELYQRIRRLRRFAILSTRLSKNTNVRSDNLLSFFLLFFFFIFPTTIRRLGILGFCVFWSNILGAFTRTSESIRDARTKWGRRKRLNLLRTHAKVQSNDLLPARVAIPFFLPWNKMAASRGALQKRDDRKSR